MDGIIMDQLRVRARGGWARTLVLSIVIGTLIFTSAADVFAQAPPPGQPPGPPAAATPAAGGPRKQLATIIYAGLAGAILGLSTLSFYGRPQEKLANIPIGFAFGVIIGTSYVTYKAASNPSEFYGVRPQLESENQFANRMDPRPEPTLARTTWAWEF